MGDQGRRPARTMIRRPASGVAIDPAKLIRARNERAWSRQELAERMGRILLDGSGNPKGFSRDAIAKIENGARRPKSATLEVLCKVLECDPKDLLADPEEAGVPVP